MHTRKMFLLLPCSFIFASFAVEGASAQESGWLTSRQWVFLGPLLQPGSCGPGEESMLRNQIFPFEIGAVDPISGAADRQSRPGARRASQLVNPKTYCHHGLHRLSPEPEASIVTNRIASCHSGVNNSN